MNPEFHRNLLLELTPHRLIAMPLILLLLYGAIGLTGEVETLARAAMFVIVALTVVWGSRLAADTVLGEVAGRTWDSQRMSALGPLSMSWGKLLGSTIFVWYGALFSVFVLLYGGGNLALVGELVLIGLTAQAVALFISLTVQRLRPQRMRFLVTQAQLSGLGAALLVGNLFEWDRYRVFWYGNRFEAEDFIAVSVVIFLGWCFLGIYRLMRAELQFRCWPVGWAAFTLFFAVYVAGFTIDWGALQSSGSFEYEAMEWLRRVLFAHIAVVGLTWIAVFVEPKGFVRLRQLRDAAARYSIRDTLRATPAWAPGFAMALATMVLVMAASPAMEALEDSSRELREFMDAGFGSSVSVFAAMLPLFLLRDIGILHFLTLDGRSRRAMLAALVYFAVLYAILPVIAVAVGLEEALPALVPLPSDSPGLFIPLVLAQVGLAGGAIAWRWRRLSNAMAENRP